MRALLVEFGRNRGALAGARALAAAGWEVGLGTQRGLHATSSSRAVAHTHEVPGPLHEEALIAAVAAAVRERGYEVVFPVEDGQLLALSRHRSRIGAVFPYPAHERVALALDRLELARIASACGLAVPKQLEPDPQELADRQLPVIVKTSRYAPQTWDGRQGRIETALVAGNEAAAAVRAIRAAGVQPLVQERVMGSLIAVVALVDGDGAVRLLLQQEAERTWPRGTGVSARARTVPLDSGLAKRVERLVRELGWFGLVELQFIRPRRGEPHLIDFNPRFYGSLELALAAGVNLPHLWAQIATGRCISPLEPPRDGVRFQWLWGDLRHATSLGGAEAVKEGFGAMRYGIGAAHGVGHLTDPAPLLAAAALKLKRRAQRQSQR
jgi:predicted ATP-grasp superfamily ATP-dependent carboligase